MGVAFLGEGIGGLLVVLLVLGAGVAAFTVMTRLRGRQAAITKGRPSLRLRAEVTGEVDRSTGSPVLILENIGGVDASEVGFHARWEVKGQEVEALVDNEKYRLPLEVLRAGERQAFDLKSFKGGKQLVLISLTWKNRAGRSEKRGLRIQT